MKIVIIVDSLNFLRQIRELIVTLVRNNVIFFNVKSVF